MLDRTPAWSRRHVEFSNNGDLIIREVGGLLDREVNLEAVLLAQHKHLLNGEGPNPACWKPQRERHGRSYNGQEAGIGAVEGLWGPQR